MCFLPHHFFPSPLASGEPSISHSWRHRHSQGQRSVSSVSPRHSCAWPRHARTSTPTSAVLTHTGQLVTPKRTHRQQSQAVTELVPDRDGTGPEDSVETKDARSKRKDMKYASSGDPFYPVELDGVVYDSFGLRIIFERDKTGFEESKEFPIRMHTVVAARCFLRM